MKVNGYTIHPIALGPHGPLAQITQHAHSEANERLLIADMATTDEGAHTPAASVQVFGRTALLSLRDKLVEIYPLPAPESQYGWLSEQRDALLSALVHTWGVLEAAGFDNLASGVQLGQTVWFVKLNDAHAESKAAIAQATGRPA